MVKTWPIVLGCDASGVVVEVGEAAASDFKIGDRVCGCTRLGIPGHSTFQEYFCMDAKLTVIFPKNLSFQQGATLGVGTYTACLGLFDGLKIKLPGPSTPMEPKDEWIVILGGAGSVGQYTIQIAKILGYKVIATCSQKTAPLVQGLGADAVIDYSKSEEEQLHDLKTITGGNFFGVWDAVARSESLARKMLMEVSVEKQKYFATTDDWTPMEKNEDHETYRTELGVAGRDEEDGNVASTNEQLESYIPFLTRLLETGKLRPNEFKVVGKGFEDVPKAVEIQQKGASAGAKVVVDLQAVE